MKRTIGCKLLYGASVLMVVGFGVNVLIDYHQYCVSLNSAPFWLWVVVDALYWLLPAAAAYIAAAVVQKKYFSKEKDYDTGK